MKKQDIAQALRLFIAENNFYSDDEDDDGRMSPEEISKYVKAFTKKVNQLNVIINHCLEKDIDAVEPDGTVEASYKIYPIVMDGTTFIFRSIEDRYWSSGEKKVTHEDKFDASYYGQAEDVKEMLKWTLRALNKGIKYQDHYDKGNDSAPEDDIDEGLLDTVKSSIGQMKAMSKYKNITDEDFANVKQTIGNSQIVQNELSSDKCFLGTKLGNLYVIYKFQPLGGQYLLTIIQDTDGQGGGQTEKFMLPPDDFSDIKTFVDAKMAGADASREEEGADVAVSETQEREKFECYDTIDEGLLDEDFPSHFDLEKFKAMTSFRERMKYCNETLHSLGRGSSRAVYLLDSKTVLKLAMNRKGIAQNEVEIQCGQYYDIQTIVAEVFESDDNGLWMVSELCQPMNDREFGPLAHMDWYDYCKYLTIFYQTNVKNNRSYNESDIPDEAWDCDLFVDICDYMRNYNAPAGDLTKIDSYGKTKDGNVVLVDYGLNDKVWASYYAR